MATEGYLYQLLGCPDGMYITFKQIKEIKFSDTARVYHKIPKEINYPEYVAKRKRIRSSLNSKILLTEKKLSQKL